ncbi:hypothetical protein H1S01_08015 [Heliobacterium chlorum]|uniref:Flagellar protein FlgN n=1 Tax=Heliobacterium chlorum TaxID=2698 RepID=A0ABR7T291_HELCL|nr:hypothetical protein [Heliobacterium chlorum]MBC9784455.1 hypothetical protein [Heliobacterium chlorum]
MSSNDLLSQVLLEMIQLLRKAEKTTDSVIAAFEKAEFDDIDWINKTLEQREILLAQLLDLNQLRNTLDDPTRKQKSLSVILDALIRSIAVKDAKILERMMVLRGRLLGEYRQLSSDYQGVSRYGAYVDANPKLFNHQG